jgi:hypothetical protein
VETLVLTDAQAKALIANIEAMSAHAPEGAKGVIESDVMRSVYLQLKRQQTTSNVKRKNRMLEVNTHD